MKSYFWLVPPIVILFSGCSGHKDHSDLDKFMTKAKLQTVRKIEAIPTSELVEIFTYTASALRSPFEPPEQALERKKIDKNIKPNRNRIKQYLEKFDISSFSMVGHISNDDGLWALVRNQKNIYRVKLGHYLGQNHGRITLIDDDEILLTELLPAGHNLWVERQRRIPMSQSNDSF